MRLALDYARRLDAMLPAADDDLHDALDQIGELLGRLSCDGFHADLLTAMDDLETDYRVMDEAWLANDWWFKAQAIMARVPAPQAMRVAA